MDLLLHRSGPDDVLTFGLTGERTSGVSQLVQAVLIDLLSDFDPALNRGSNLRRNLADVGEDEQTAAEQAVEEALRAVRSHVFAQQQADPSLRPDERLKSLTLLSVRSAGVRRWKIELALVNMRGEQTRLVVPENSGA